MVTCEKYKVSKNVKIANWFLKAGMENSKPLTQMHLQKMMFFAHALGLASKGKPVCDGSFYAWKYGPVLPDIYEYTKEWGRTPITELIHIPGNSAYQLTTPKVGSSEADLIDFLQSTWRNYSRFDAIELSIISHEEGGPWHQVYDPTLAVRVISDRSIADFYKTRVSA